MKYLNVCLLVAATTFVGWQCAPAETTKGTTVATFRGLYAYGPEVSTLYDCATKKTYWVNDTSKRLSTNYTRTLLQPAWPFEPIYVVIKGTLTDKAAEGYARQYDGTINLTGIDSLASVNYSNCCQPFEFIGAGTEPFWNLFISETQHIIALKSLADEQVYTFDYQQPTKKDGIITYTATQNADTISVQIVKKPSSDGMSDLTYPYECTVTHNKQTNIGVALGQNDKIRE